MAQRTLSALALVALWLTGAAVAAAPAVAGCDDHYPEAGWRPIGETALLVVEITPSVSDGEGLRFADEAATTARMLEADLGTLPPLSLCVFNEEDELDPADLVPPGHLLHAAVFNEDATLFVNTLQLGRFDETHAFGLAYATLWHVATLQGHPGYPEPMATVVGQWYLSRVADKLELHHSQMRAGAFFRDPGGGGIETTDWAQGTQAAVYSWNPQFQESPLADFVQYAVDQHGAGVLSDIDPDRWAAIEQEWQSALREEALQGASGGSDWVIGLTIFFGFIALAGLTAWLTHRSRIKAREEARQRGEAEAAV